MRIRIRNTGEITIESSDHTLEEEKKELSAANTRLPKTRQTQPNQNSGNYETKQRLQTDRSNQKESHLGVETARKQPRIRSSTSVTECSGRIATA